MLLRGKDFLSPHSHCPRGGLLSRVCGNAGRTGRQLHQEAPSGTIFLSFLSHSLIQLDVDTDLAALTTEVEELLSFVMKELKKVDEQKAAGVLLGD